jgi:hypothetical protein
MNGTEHDHLPQDLLEEAARGHLPADLLAAIDTHCAVCGPCRDAYREERRIAQGARSWARAALKQRLASTVAADRSRAIPWPRILAAAAVILVLAGTGLVYRWLNPGTEAPIRITETGSVDSLTVLAERAASTHNETRVLTETNSAISPDKKEDAVQEQDEALADQQRAKAVPSETPPVVPAAAPVMKAARTADAAGAAERTEQELIVWGAPLAGESDKKDKGVTRTETQQTQIIRNGMGSRAQGTVGAAAVSPPAHVYLVTQQNILAMNRRDALARPDAIPARITRDGDTIRVVLLLTSPVSADDLRSAFVQDCPPDSFQVILPGMRLGFKTPGGFLR